MKKLLIALLISMTTLSSSFANARSALAVVLASPELEAFEAEAQENEQIRLSFDSAQLAATMRCLGCFAFELSYNVMSADGETLLNKHITVQTRGYRIPMGPATTGFEIRVESIGE